MVNIKAVRGQNHVFSWGVPGVRLFPFGLDSHSGLCLWGSPCIDFGFTVDARE